MSPSVNITRRTRTSGVRYVVRYRLGGAETQPQHAGSFKTLREAEARARWVAGELAAMRVPDIRAIARETTPPTIAAAATRWVRRRHDVAPSTIRAWERAAKRIAADWGATHVGEVTPGDVSDWIAAMVASGAGRGNIQQAILVLRGALDDHRDPNPARHRTVRMPRYERVEAAPPPTAHWELIRERVTPRVRDALDVLEGTGLRVGELQALTWGDIDVPGGRLFVRRGKTSTARRWVPVPGHLMDLIEARRPREDRDPAGLVFADLGTATLRVGMRRACIASGIPVYSPHDLRHRFITLAIRRGMDPAAVAAVVGHARKSMTLDTYSHLLLEDA